jgi:NTP pyrophosphatase (non-canonical NTP hydrolase)
VSKVIVARTNRGKCTLCPEEIQPGQEYRSRKRDATAAEMRDESVKKHFFPGRGYTAVEERYHEACRVAANASRARPDRRRNTPNDQPPVEGLRGLLSMSNETHDGHTQTVTSGGVIPASVRTDNGLLRDMAEEVTEVNIANGWFESSRSFGDDIALLHSEVTEMLEAYRDGHLTNRYKFESEDGFAYAVPGDPNFERWAAAKLPKPEGLPSEAADVLVRLLDTCKRYDIDLFAAWREKLDYNRTRGHRHGGKTL